MISFNPINIKNIGISIGANVKPFVATSAQAELPLNSITDYPFGSIPVNFSTDFPKYTVCKWGYLFNSDKSIESTLQNVREEII